MDGCKNSSLKAADSKIGCLDLSQIPREKENMLSPNNFTCKDIARFLQRYWYLRKKESPGIQKHGYARKK